MKKLNFEKLNLAEASKTLRSIKKDRFISKINNNEVIKQKLNHLATWSGLNTIKTKYSIIAHDSKNNHPVLVKEKKEPEPAQTQKQNFYDWLVKCGNIYTADAQRMDLALDSIIEY